MERTVWPKFWLPDDPLGRSSIFDFCEADQCKIRSIAEDSLDSLFQSFNISASVQPEPAVSNKQQQQQHGSCFGVSLESLAKAGEGDVPLLVRSLLQTLRQRGLGEEGIFRLSGSVQTVRQLRDKVEKDGMKSIETHLADADPHDVVALLKMFLRELPHQLLGYRHREYFLLLHQLQPLRTQLLALNLLIILLPTASSRTLLELVELLVEVANNRTVTLMTERSLASVLAPNLLQLQQQHELHRCVDVMEMMMVYRDILWKIPTFAARMLRQRNGQLQPEQNGDSDTAADQLPPWALGRDASPSPPPRPASPLAIRDSSGGLREIIADDDTTADDVLQELNYAKSSIWEIGGNIEGRRLPPDARLRRVLRANSNCSLQLRSD